MDEEQNLATVGKDTVLSVEIDGVWVPIAKVMSSSIEVPKGHAMTTDLNALNGMWQRYADDHAVDDALDEKFEKIRAAHRMVKGLFERPPRPPFVDPGKFTVDEAARIFNVPKRDGIEPTQIIRDELESWRRAAQTLRSMGASRPFIKKSKRRLKKGKRKRAK